MGWVGPTPDLVLLRVRGVSRVVDAPCHLIEDVVAETTRPHSALEEEDRQSPTKSERNRKRHTMEEKKNTKKEMNRNGQWSAQARGMSQKQKKLERGQVTSAQEAQL